MVIPALVIGGSVLYIGSRVYRRRRKQPGTWLNTLAQDASYQNASQPPISHQGQNKLLPKVAIGAGVVAVGTALVVAAGNGVSPLLVTNRLMALLQQSAYGPLLFIAAYATLPLLLFPSTLLTLAAGSLFGSTQGILYTIIGSNLSALAAYQIGRRLRRLSKTETPEKTKDPQAVDSHLRVIQPFMERMRANPFPTVLTMHCLFLPYEFVSYGAGLLELPFEAFAPATTIGMLPWTFSLVLAGASLQSTFLTGFPAVDPTVLAASGLICVGSLALAAYINGRHTTATKSEAAETMTESSQDLQGTHGPLSAPVPVTM